MLRIYRHYIPALVFVTIAADLAVIVSAMLAAAWIGFPNGVGALWSKMVVLAAVNILALYLADLYQLDFRIRRVELASRLLVALLVSVTTSAAIGFVLPALGLGRLAFIFTSSAVIALGLLASRLTWLALGPSDD